MNRPFPELAGPLHTRFSRSVRPRCAPAGSRKTVGRIAAAALLAAAVGLPSAAAAEPEPQVTPEAPPAIEDATRHLLRALKLMLMAIPRYAPPEVLENGDILIRRIPLSEDTTPAPAPGGGAPDRTDI